MDEFFKGQMKYTLENSGCKCENGTCTATTSQPEQTTSTTTTSTTTTRQPGQTTSSTTNSGFTESTTTKTPTSNGEKIDYLNVDTSKYWPLES